MSDNANKTLDLKTKPIRASQINRGLVMAVVGGLGVLALIIFMLALEPPSHKHTPLTLQTSQSLAGKDEARFASLPSSYADAKGIAALLDRNQSMALPQEVAKELAVLKAQQQSLKNQLAVLRGTRQTTPTEDYSASDQQAISSPMFFPGEAPLVPIKSKSTQKSVAKKSSIGADKQLKGAEDAYAKQNMQADKINFFDAKPSKDIYNKAQVQFPLSKYIIQAGEVIPAVLQTQIVSDNPGMIVALVNQDVYDNITGQYLLIPKGSKLIGKYSSKLSYHQSSIQAKFTRLIRPDGTSIVLQSMPGANGLGVSGLTDTVDNHWGLIIGSAVLSAVFNLPAIVATNQADTPNYNQKTGQYIQPPLGSQAKVAALQSVGQSASDVGNKLTTRALGLQPTITIHAGYKFAVLVNKDMILPPYQHAFSSDRGG